MRLCTVQTIFVPDKARLQRQLRSLQSQRTALPGVDRYLAGWCAHAAYWEAIDRELARLQPRAVRRQTRNWGKARNVNELVAALDADVAYDAMLTMDSDIVFRDDVRYVHELSRLYHALRQDHTTVGVLALQQEEGCCHVLTQLTRRRDVAGHTLRWHDSGGGIAGGCLLVDLAFWRRAGGYRVMGVYAGDDAYIFQDAKKHGAFFALVTSVPVIHPPDPDAAYAAWKLRTCTRDTTGTQCTEDQLRTRSEEASQFWHDNSDAQK